MRLTKRTLGWGGLLALALLGLATLPVAWAAPEGRGLLQTVPTRTPTPGPATNTPVPPAPTQPPQQPTDAPPATLTATQVAPTATVTEPATDVPSTSTSTPTPTPTTSLDEASGEVESSGVQGGAAAPVVTSTATQAPSDGVTTTETLMTPTATAVDPAQAGDEMPTQEDANTATAEPVAVTGRSDTSQTWIWVLGAGGLVLGAGIALLLKFRK